jgi:hypothetical protein
MTTMALMVAATLLGASPAATKKVFPDLFVAGVCNYKDDQNKQKSLPYRLFIPESPQPKERYPLLVWPIFGDWLNKLVFDDPKHAEKYRFFVLVIGVSHEGFDKILQQVTEKYPVDQDRVYLSGSSRGGWVCWNIAMTYPDLIAGIVPMGAPRADPSNADRLADIPIWAFHSHDETYVPRAGTEEMVATIKNAGGTVHLTLVPSKDHDCWTAAVKKHGALEWLFAQRRGAWTCWVPPGAKPWQWRHILTIPFVYAVIMGFAWHIERSMRIRRSTQNIAQTSAFGFPSNKMPPGKMKGQKPAQLPKNPSVMYPWP